MPFVLLLLTHLTGSVGFPQQGPLIDMAQTLNASDVIGPHFVGYCGETNVSYPDVAQLAGKMRYRRSRATRFRVYIRVSRTTFSQPSGKVPLRVTDAYHALHGTQPD